MGIEKLVCKTVLFGLASFLAITPLSSKSEGLPYNPNLLPNISQNQNPSSLKPKENVPPIKYGKLFPDTAMQIQYEKEEVPLPTISIKYPAESSLSSQFFINLASKSENELSFNIGDGFRFYNHPSYFFLQNNKIFADRTLDIVKSSIQQSFVNYAGDWAKQNFLDNWTESVADFFLGIPDDLHITSPVREKEGVPGIYNGPDKRWNVKYPLFDGSADLSIVYKPTGDRDFINLRIGPRNFVELIESFKIGNDLYFYSGTKFGRADVSLRDKKLKLNSVKTSFNPNLELYAGISKVKYLHSIDGIPQRTLSFNLGATYTNKRLFGFSDHNPVSQGTTIAFSMSYIF
jgi:hypothetical protein